MDERGIGVGGIGVMVLARVVAVVARVGLAGAGVEAATGVALALWPTFNAIYAKWAGSARPASCVVPVPQLHFGVKIEVEAVAVR